jgi:hypothetical protein
MLFLTIYTARSRRGENNTYSIAIKQETRIVEKINTHRERPKLLHKIRIGKFFLYHYGCDFILSAAP